MYACSSTVSASVLSIIVSSGVEVLDGDKTYGPKNDGSDDARKMLHYYQLKMIGVMGMFDPITPDKLYIFDRVEERLVDYVMLHELGHLMSYRARLGFHALAERLGLHTENPLRRLDFSQMVELKRLQFEEECIADCFALNMLLRLGLNFDIDLLHQRLDKYEQVLGSARVEELNGMAFQLGLSVSERIAA